MPNTLKIFICSHCDWRIEFVSHDEDRRKEAWAKANEHEQSCQRNPLVIKIQTLEAQMERAQKCGKLMQLGAQLVESAEVEVDEVLALIRKECHKHITLLDPSKAQGFKNIEKLVAKVLG